MESRFGRDFSGVRVHTDSAASESAKLIQAKAFTVRQDVFFASGQFMPENDEGRTLLAHELTHVVQQGAAAFADDRPAPAIMALSTAHIARQEDDPDHPPVQVPATGEPEITLEPLTDWNPEVDTWDQATFWTPPGTTREQITVRLYGDPHHYGGFDLIEDKHVRMRNFDGVVTDVVTPMREALDRRMRSDVDVVVDILKQRWIDDADEWRLLNITVWWASRGDLTNAANRSYFDAYLDLLDTHRLTEPGIFSDTTRTASEWLLVEAEEKQWAIYPLLGRRSSRGTPRHHRTGREMPEETRESGPITASTREVYYRNIVGTYEFRAGENRIGIESEQHGTNPIRVGELIVTETSATRAEIALRNSSRRSARVMIPGGDGNFYGYTIGSPGFWNEGYVQPADPQAQRLQNYWWHYPGTVFIPGGSFQAEFAQGGESEHAQRTEILSRALAAGLEQLRGLDFDVLSMMTLDQRVTTLNQAVGTGDPGDASLIARILYLTPSAEFAALEHRLSTSGTMSRLLSLSSPEGALAMIGRIFTLKAVEAMQVPGETLENLPEFSYGFDQDGYYHYAFPSPTMASSRLLSATEFPRGGAVGIGQERVAAGESPRAITRTVTTIQPAILRLGGEGTTGGIVNFYRGLAGTLITNDGPPLGPYLPTQLVRIRRLGPNPETRIVTVLEAVGLLDIPRGQILNQMLSAATHFGMAQLATLGLARAFGPALAASIAEGGGARAIAAAAIRTATTEAGRAALVNAALIAGMEAVDRNRADLLLTPEGRAFLEIYDVAIVIWISHDVARLITSGLVPRLVAAADRVMALPGLLRDAIMPLRAEAEAIRRAIARFATPAEAAAAASTEGVTMAAGAEARPGFFAMLRVTRGEVAAERLAERIAGTPVQAAGRRVLGRLEGAITAAERDAAAATGTTTEAAEIRAAATRRAQSAASARLAVAQRAAQLRPEAREAFLNAVDGVIAARPNSVASLTDLLTAAAQSRTPNTFIAEVQQLVSRPGVDDDALRVLGAKVREGPNVLDLAWLNRTSISDEALNFLGRDRRTPWDLYRRAAADPTSGSLIRSFRTSARGASAEMVAEAEANRLGTNVRRQVPMGSSEIDYEITVAGRRHGFEVKGWTAGTWEEALEAAIQRLNRRGLTDAQRQAVGKIDTMIRQLQDAQAATGRAPYLGFTDALTPQLELRLRRVLERNGLGSTRFVPLSEGEIKEAAAGTIGEALGIPRP